MLPIKIESIIRQGKTYLPQLNEKRLLNAYFFAKEAHKNQQRVDGTSYIIHPLSAAFTLTRLHADEDTLIATLIHDVPEDTDYTFEDIKEKFGAEIAFLVEGATKLEKVNYRNNMADRQIESIKKFLLHSTQDIRILFIKLADRLHNMQTLSALPREKQLRVAHETMDIYIPIANLLGIWEIKQELEDLCFRYIYPDEYEELNSKMKQIHTKHDRQIKSMKTTLEKNLTRLKISAEVSLRPQNLFTIFQKMVETNRRLNDTDDLLGIRIIVHDKETCYRVLGIIHELFRPKAGRVKDYIAIPKVNGYKSLHTTVFAKGGILTEFQIRTTDMQAESDYGIAAHYYYNKQCAKNSTNCQCQWVQKQSTWMKKIIDMQRENNNNGDFIKNLKVDIFRDRIFVFTPSGDVLDLPEGAIGVDFAYHIHSDLGDQAIKIYRNGQEFPITSELKTGETLEVITSKKQKIPPREWIEKVKTNLAKRKISESLKRQSRPKCYRDGIKFLAKELHRYGCNELATISPEQKNFLLEKFDVKTWHEFIEQVGEGEISQYEVIQNLYPIEKIMGIPHRTTKDYSPLAKIHYSKIEGAVVRRTSISSPAPYYRLTIFLKIINRVGILRDIGIELANLGVNIYKIEVEPDPKIKKYDFIMVIEVISLQQLQRVFESLESIDGVREVIRIN
ncbi:MAG: (p)ppGpp synthetase I SpoT/RelA, GTP pyrophosphokinase [Candidatus Peregrinibacteria bacterium GW2011_GWF2_39_17]|nr:MAG: (p)ppGpp synthetase I SpoT/RelA, GTP pyrophosphokinase [Candidatus Peregrinibacteria bacterium GW2011_GWF2_39_17]